MLNSYLCLCVYQVWDLVEKYDTGCTAGSGKNSMSVFYDAGLLFETNTADGTPYRQGKATYLHPSLHFCPYLPVYSICIFIQPDIWKAKALMESIVRGRGSMIEIIMLQLAAQNKI